MVVRSINMKKETNKYIEINYGNFAQVGKAAHASVFLCATLREAAKRLLREKNHTFIQQRQIFCVMSEKIIPCLWHLRHG
ncbi:MAG: hypothetical protein V7K14_01395 [Nostoc sp.]|uniref:hypothetical protein n=1 Tax=Nostoc sp. TaxID=1180 RepID=UPI002FFA87AE